MQVRLALPHEADRCAAVVGLVAEEGRYLITEAPVDLLLLADRMRTAIEGGRDRIWVLRHADDIVGTLGLHPTSTEGLIGLGMAIHPDARGRGGGRALLQAALDDADDRRVVKIELEVFTDNARAIALYAAHGFAVEGLRRAHYPRRDGTRRDVLVMARFTGGGPPPSPPKPLRY